MKRKRITRLFPFLLPIRRIQRKIFFDAAMRLGARLLGISIRPLLGPSRLGW